MSLDLDPTEAPKDFHYHVLVTSSTTHRNPCPFRATKEAEARSIRARAACRLSTKFFPNPLGQTMRNRAWTAAPPFAVDATSARLRPHKQHQGHQGHPPRRMHAQETGAWGTKGRSPRDDAMPLALCGSTPANGPMRGSGGG